MFNPTPISIDIGIKYSTSNISKVIIRYMRNLATNTNGMLKLNTNLKYYGYKKIEILLYLFMENNKNWKIIEQDLFPHG